MRSPRVAFAVLVINPRRGAGPGLEEFSRPAASVGVVFDMRPHGRDGKSGWVMGQPLPIA